MVARIEPATTFAAIFAPGTVLVPRRSPNLHGWSPLAPGQVDAQTGHLLGAAGAIDVVVHAGACTPEGLDLLAASGLPVAARLLRYRSNDEHVRLVEALVSEGRRLAIQRTHPDAEVPEASAVVPMPLLAALNDKGRMAQLVPPDWLPERQIIDVAQLARGASLPADRPVVLKVATGAPNGGGHGVFICRSAAEIEAARTALGEAGERRVVVEPHLPIERTVCVSATVAADGATRVWGSAEEVVKRGRWLGNWLDAAGDAPAAALDVVCVICERASARGYRGVVGIDVARLTDGTLRVLDLNFRVNGSTVAVWLRDAIERDAGGPRSLRVRAWTHPGGFAALMAVARAAARRGTLVPLGSYDPDAGAHGGAARLAGIVVGTCREAVRDEEARLAAEGLS